MNKFETLQSLFDDDLNGVRKSIPKDAWKEGVGLNVAFGVTNTEIPARFLSGFVPSATLAETIRGQQKIDTQLRIFVPLHLAVTCGVDASNAVANRNQGLLMIQKFHDVFHPTLHWFLDEDLPITENAIETLREWSDSLIDHAPHLQSEWEKVRQSARRRGNEETANIYAPHHVFGWQDCWMPSDFFEATPSHVTFNCLSSAEKPFQVIREQMLGLIRETKPELLVEGVHNDLTTSVCRRPHYLSVRVGELQEPSVNDLLQIGFEQVKQELDDMTSVSAKFKKAHEDLVALELHIDEMRNTQPGLPNTEEFVQEIARAQDW